MGQFKYLIVVMFIWIDLICEVSSDQIKVYAKLLITSNSEVWALCSLSTYETIFLGNDKSWS